MYRHDIDWRRERYYANRSMLGTDEEIKKERRYLIYELESSMLLSKISTLTSLIKQHHSLKYNSVNDFIAQEYRYALRAFYRSCRGYQRKIKSWYKIGNTAYWKRELPKSLIKEVGNKEYGYGKLD